jgi:hypothetical protein
LSDLPFQYIRDDSLSAPLNWTFAPERPAEQLTHIFYNVETRMQRDLPELTPGRPIKGDYRLVSFKGDLSQSLYIDYQPPACLKVFDPIRDQHLPEKPKNYRRLLAFSDPMLILTEIGQSSLPPGYLGPEPDPDWCYYYQKAELARQTGDWAQVAAFADEALTDEDSLNRRQMPEILPYIEGYARRDQWEKAIHLTQLAFEKWDGMHTTLCDLWQQISQTTQANERSQVAIELINHDLKCSP